MSVIPGWSPLSGMSNHLLQQCTLEHQLLDCPSLSTTWEHCTLLWRKYCIDKPEVRAIVMLENNGDDYSNTSMQLLLEPSCCPKVICAIQTWGTCILAHIQYLTRTWCYSHHLRRYKLLKLLNIKWCLYAAAQLTFGDEDDIWIQRQILT